MYKILLITLLALFSFSAHAEFSIATGVDIDHDAGKPYAEVRYFGEQWKHWSAYIGTDNTIGGDLYFTVYDNIQLGLGAEYADADPDTVSTNWAYELRVEYLFNDTWSVGVKHRSNCKTLCDYPVLEIFPHGDEDSKNHGFNYLFIRYKF